MLFRIWPMLFFTLSKNPYSTKPMVTLNFSMLGLFQLLPTECTIPPFFVEIGAFPKLILCLCIINTFK